MSHEMKSIIALNSFKEDILNLKEFGRDGFVFDGLVTYKVVGGIYSEILKVYLIIGGYEPMIKLDIHAEGRVIVSSKFHLDFNPAFSNTVFEYNNNRLLIIGRSSPKLGDYEVNIEEYLGR
jgi:hypothetical protein